MCKPIRTLTEAKGHSASAHHLAVFGGGGGQMGCGIGQCLLSTALRPCSLTRLTIDLCSCPPARSLGISRVLLHKNSSILSAYGIALADAVEEAQEPFSGEFNAETEPAIRARLDGLYASAAKRLAGTGAADPKAFVGEYYANMRYEGSDTTAMILKPTGSWDLATAFEEHHKAEFGFKLLDRPVLVEDLRVRVISPGQTTSVAAGLNKRIDSFAASTSRSVPVSVNKVCFKGVGLVDCPLYQLDDLSVGARIAGPASIVDQTSTIIVAPHCTATVLDEHVAIDVEPEVPLAPAADQALVVDPIQLSIFGHRYMGVAEQMGRILQKTAVSVNIRDRLDFSTAIFDATGGLVANAPHVPAMLGSMSFAVRWQAEHWKGNLVDGDVLISNHPVAGGVHLPDLTVVTPVFGPDGKEIIFYTASRGHHVRPSSLRSAPLRLGALTVPSSPARPSPQADVGGAIPGSMPPNSKTIFDEGASIESFKVIKAGQFDEAGIVNLLVDVPASYPGGSGTRTLADNLSDIRAQIAATFKGVNLIKALVQQHTLPVVQLYMRAIQDSSEQAVRALLKKFAARNNGEPLVALDHMDDGTPVALKITIDKVTGASTFDFTGTGPEVYGARLFSLGCRPSSRG